MDEHLMEAIKVCRVAMVRVQTVDHDFLSSDTDMLLAIAELVEQQHNYSLGLLMETVRLRDVIRRLDSELAEARRG